VSVRARRITYIVVMLAIMPLSGWDGTYTMWETLLGQDVGHSMAVFWDLQVETWSGVILFAPIIDLAYGMHRTPDGWDFAPKGWRVRGAIYAALVVLALVCSAEGPLRDVFDVALPADVALSTAHYFRRALEGVLTVIGLMIFLDFVRPGRLADRLGRRDTQPAAAATRSDAVASAAADGPDAAPSPA